MSVSLVKDLSNSIQAVLMAEGNVSAAMRVPEVRVLLSYPPSANQGKFNMTCRLNSDWPGRGPIVRKVWR